MKKLSLILAIGLALAANCTVVRADSNPPKAWQDVRALVVRFNDAQNSHNVDVVNVLLLNSPSFAWSSGGGIALGHDEAVARLAAIYQKSGGTFSVLPDYGSLNIELVSPTEAVASFQTQFKTSPPEQDTVIFQSTVREQAENTPEGWRLSSIDTSPSPLALF